MVVCGFPGVGKAYAVKHWNHPDYKIYDSDSSDFSWVDKNDHSKGRNPDFLMNYIERWTPQSSAFRHGECQEYFNTAKEFAFFG